MIRIILPLFLLISFVGFGNAQEVDSLQMQINEIENGLTYQTGDIELPANNAVLHIPKNLRFLDAKQAKYVLEDLWGNPKSESTIGLLVPKDKGVLADDSWVFTIAFDESGYISDEDANEIDYDDLLEEQQEETSEANIEREKLGYPSIELVGWASKPFYNENQKTLHWAKELKFGNSEINTLNYNLRILGRKGMYIVNAVANMSEMDEIKPIVPQVVASIDFKEGHRYEEFDDSTDKIAAWTVGGLVAGKVLAKTGILVGILKFWKLILVGIAGIGASIKKLFKKDE